MLQFWLDCNQIHADLKCIWINLDDPKHLKVVYMSFIGSQSGNYDDDFLTLMLF